MITARLLGYEGTTIMELALPDAEENPRQYVYRAVIGKLTCYEAPPESLLPVRKVSYALERRDGAGTYIYRAESPW